MTDLSKENPFRDIQYGRIYDRLYPNQTINIAAFGDISILIDEANLGLERVSLESLHKGWEKDKEIFSAHCVKLGIDIEPFEVYKYQRIQSKTLQVLGPSIQNVGLRNKRFHDMGDKVNLSETKGFAMCSEYAILSTFIAQKIGEPARLIIGSAVETNDKLKWRESHAFGWIDGLNCVFDSVLASSDREYPAIMQPTISTALEVLESGKDIKAKRIGSNFYRFYGLEAGGFGIEMDSTESNVE